MILLIVGSIMLITFIVGLFFISKQPKSINQERFDYLLHMMELYEVEHKIKPNLSNK